MGLAAILGLSWYYAAGASASRNLFDDYLLPCFLALYGVQDPLFLRQIPPSWLVVLLAILAVLLPALLLGAVVYKVLAPSRNLLVFRKKLELVERAEGSHLVVYFYICSNVALRLLEFTAIARLYESSRTPGIRGNYPMKTFTVGTEWSQFHLPFPYVSSTVFVPVRMVEETDPPGETDMICLMRDADGALAVHSAGGRRVRPECGDFLELFMLATAKVPALQSDHTELFAFRLPDAISPVELHPMRTPFNLRRYRFETPAEDWARYDS